MGKTLLQVVSIIMLLLWLQGCATYATKVRPVESNITHSDDVKKTNEIYFLGGAAESEATPVLKALASELENNTVPDKYVVFTGDNIKAKSKKEVEAQLDRQINSVKGKDATAYFIPGNYDWSYDAMEGLEQVEDYLREKLEKDEILLPNNGCPIESVELSDGIQLIAVDSQWFINDWDKLPKMNDKCEIKSRKKFLLEVEGELKKNANKLILLVMHHPMYTNGIHGGRFSLRDHIFPLGGDIPLPVFASVVAEIRSQGAISTQDRYNSRYNELMEKLLGMIRSDDKRVVIVSGHEKNLQYIEDGVVKQLISGSAASRTAVRLGEKGVFASGETGFASISLAEDNSVWIKFFGNIGSESELELFTKKIFDAPEAVDFSHLPEAFPKTFSTSVYESELVDKSDFFKSFWGNHYREVYGTQVEANVAVLDTLYGGLEVVRPGGGHQTRSLRLKSKSGKEYNMRALRKSAVQFLETVAFKGIDGEKYFSNTIPEQLILDFYTAAHPYAAFAIPGIAKAAKVYYTTPELFYVPKQKSLGKYNEEYGDQLYMIVERPSEEYTNSRSFGYPDDIESTDDLLEKLREDEENVLDEETYIRARLFDMLIGDWDRHSDQWRWAVFENEAGKTVFEPIPRDRDQVFANFDGSFLSALRSIMGSFNQFGVYGPDIEDIEWFNLAGSKLDRALLKRTKREDWVAQAKFLQNSIDEQTLDRAFAALPKEVQDGTLDEIKQFLIQRKANLVSIAERYYDYLIKFQMLTGTDKDDLFEIERKPNGITEINAYRIKDGEKGDLLFSRTFDKIETEEIWLYGLDDKDRFVVTGKPDKPILIRIIGGQNKDSYYIEHGKKIKVYDRKSKNSIVERKGGALFRFTNIYSANTYDYQKIKSTGGGISSFVGYNADEGTVLNFGYRKDVNEFITNPFGRRTEIALKYQFLTQGLDARLSKAYAAAISKFNLLIDGRYTSRNYTENFFGFGNETINNDDTLSLDYNRVNLEILEAGAGLYTVTDYGSTFKVKLDFQGVKVRRNGSNFISGFTSEAFGEFNYFAKPTLFYGYKNVDDNSFISRGLKFAMEIGGIDDLQNSDLSGTGKIAVDFYNALTHDDKLVLQTGFKGKSIVGDTPDFFNSVQLGEDTGLRGFRRQRFTGRHSALINMDLHYKFNNIKTILFPLGINIYAGYDLGRVWVKNDNSSLWHQAYGGGINMRWTDAIQGNLNYFRSKEDDRITFGFGLSL